MRTGVALSLFLSFETGLLVYHTVGLLSSNFFFDAFPFLGMLCYPFEAGRLLYHILYAVVNTFQRFLLHFFPSRRALIYNIKFTSPCQLFSSLYSLFLHVFVVCEMLRGVFVDNFPLCGKL
jgi:hypothetical protein